MKAICVTGHREIPSDKIEYVRQELRREAERAVEDGFTLFISGFAEGVDIEFAAIVAEMKAEIPALFLEAAIPHPGRMRTKDTLFHKLIAQCNGVKIVSGEYSPDCYFVRNRYLIENSERVVAVFDGRQHGGTAQTMRMAVAKGCNLRIIDISNTQKK